ncbi:MAG: GGDEF domain-containing protein [Spirochaetia bacterium]|nr:MAG: GGDEF domain-containing protein [Spirochaetia bacterium]
MESLERVEKNEISEAETLRQRVETLEAENAGLKIENVKLKEDLIHDSLTGLKTRKYFAEEAEDNLSAITNPESEKREEGFHNVSYLFCDIDHFKKINDKFGHDAGDAVLKKVAKILEENVRESDTVCRWGGEEMVISLLGADEKEAVEKAEELRKKIEEGTDVSLSIGVSAFEEETNFDELINRGDRAMYAAKEEGRNRVKTYSEVLEKEEMKGK